MNRVNIQKTHQSEYKELTTYHDKQYQTLWYYMNHKNNSCFSPELLHDLKHFLSDLKDRCHTTEADLDAIRYTVVASNKPNIFNLGGDLALFIELIKSKQKESLFEYAKACIDVIYTNYTISKSKITSLALIQGDALGGGFEAALATDVIIAEKGVKIGFPEILFNLFPGMGAYSFLSRKIGSIAAEKMIISGKIYRAEELHEMGVIDILAEPEQGELAVYDYIQKEKRSAKGIRALRQAKKITNPIQYEEFINITNIWVDTALSLEAKDLRMMERLISRQNYKSNKAA